MRRVNCRGMFLMSLVPLSISSFATGCVYYIPNTNVMIAASVGLRFLQGILSYPNCLCPVDFSHAYFEDIFDLVNGIQTMGNFGGHGIAESIGGVLYDKYGYMAPFIFSSSITLIVSTVAFFLIPTSKTYLATQNEAPKKKIETIYPSEVQGSRLSKLLVFPMIATMLINANYGVFQVLDQ